MSNKPVFYLILFLFLTGNSLAQNNVEVKIPSSGEEAEYIWWNIRNITFFEEHGYDVSLPRGEFIEKLKGKARSNELTDSDLEDLKVYMKDAIYKKDSYSAGYQKIKAQIPLVTKMLGEIPVEALNWEFLQFDRYRVNLTLYGSGGSYNPDNGSIIIYSNENGEFKGYPNPANTLIHEMIHIGIESSIISKYNVPHTLKEAIVDKLVLLWFGDYLPDYQAQSFGDLRINDFLKSKEDIKDLDKHVQAILNKTSKKRFSSYFLSFETGPQIELMHKEDIQKTSSERISMIGLAHFAISLGSKDKVDELTERLRMDEYAIIGELRITGDGFYESVISDPEGNLIELTI